MYINEDVRVDDMSNMYELIAMEPMYGHFKDMINIDIDYDLYKKIYVKFFDIWCDADFEDNKEYYIEKNIHGTKSMLILDNKNVMANFGCIWNIVYSSFKNINIICDKFDMVMYIFNDFTIFSVSNQ